MWVKVDDILAGYFGSLAHRITEFRIQFLGGISYGFSESVSIIQTIETGEFFITRQGFTAGFGNRWIGSNGRFGVWRGS